MYNKCSFCLSDVLSGNDVSLDTSQINSSAKLDYTNNTVMLNYLNCSTWFGTKEMFTAVKH